MRNQALQQLGSLIGDWTLTMTNAWFLDDPAGGQPGAGKLTWWR